MKAFTILIFLEVLKQENFKIHTHTHIYTHSTYLGSYYTDYYNSHIHMQTDSSESLSILMNMGASRFFKFLFQTSKIEGTKEEKAWKEIHVTNIHHVMHGAAALTSH